MKKAYIFLAQGFEETEALCPWDILLRAKVEVKTVSVTENYEVTGTHGLTVHADMLSSQLPDELDADLVMLPGGMPGAANLDASPAVDSYLRQAADNGKLIAAICAAPFVLGKRGLLDKKRATCFPGYEKELTGAFYTKAKVVRDGNIITGIGMGAAFEFGLAVVGALCGDEVADALGKSTLFRLSDGE